MSQAQSVNAQNFFQTLLNKATRISFETLDGMGLCDYAAGLTELHEPVWAWTNAETFTEEGISAVVAFPSSKGPVIMGLGLKDRLIYPFYRDGFTPDRVIKTGFQLDYGHTEEDIKFILDALEVPYV